jgi:hypothetical protein
LILLIGGDFEKVPFRICDCFGGLFGHGACFYSLFSARLQRSERLISVEVLSVHLAALAAG